MVCTSHQENTVAAYGMNKDQTSAWCCVYMLLEEHIATTSQGSHTEGEGTHRNAYKLNLMHISCHMTKHVLLLTNIMLNVTIARTYEVVDKH